MSASNGFYFIELASHDSFRQVFAVTSQCSTEIRVSTTPGTPGNPGNLLEFKNPPGNPGNLLEFTGPPGNFCVR